MACHLLKVGWSTDEIKARLGHKPSSRVLDKYINYLAIGRHVAKKKVQQAEINDVLERLAQKDLMFKELTRRYDSLESDIKFVKATLAEVAGKLNRAKR